MSNLNIFYLILVILSYLPAKSQVSGYIKKAEISLEKGNLTEAISNYSAALINDPQNIKANIGLGMIYSDLLDNYTTAQPFLEKALLLAGKDSVYDVIFELAKCYQFNKDFDKAINYLERLKGISDTEEESNFAAEVQKRKWDCEYAKLHAGDAPPKNMYLVNAGKRINTEMPEYVPVITSKELIFTSKRKDDPKEELNYLDGKYFESMYTAKIGPGGFSQSQRYNLPDQYKDEKLFNHHFAVVSVSQDGKTLYTFKDSKLYEVSLDGKNEKETDVLKFEKTDNYENHAFLTRDGSTLYFTSDRPGGLGGTDIYSRSKKPDGTWTEAQNLGPIINTPFNEESPFIAADGLLYFASEGHPGFGNYDIYKSRLNGGVWSSPENLGPPINTTGQDIFMVLDSTCSVGYFASDRPGGYGDMDIYKFMFINRIKQDCQPMVSDLITMSSEDKDTSDYKNRLIIHLPETFHPLSVKWNINGEAIDCDALSLEKDYGRTGIFPASVKLLVGCDTCLMPIVACLNYDNKIEKIPPVVVSLPPINKDSLLKEKLAACMPAPTKGKRNKLIVSSIDLEKSNIIPLTESELLAIGISNKRFLFELNKSDLMDSTRVELKQVVKACADNRDIGLVLVGYADSRGGVNPNKELSLRRAKEVQKFLVSKGVSKARILSVEGQGAAGFLNDCGPGVDCPEEQHMQNRRVELIFVRISSK